MRKPSVRKTSFYLACFCFCILIGAGLLQHHENLELCPLCVIQRGFFLILTVFFLIGSLFTPLPSARRWYYTVALLLTVGGLITAAWHIHLQHVPPSDAISCGATLGYMFKVLPFTEVLRLVIQGTGDCGIVQWRFIGLSIPEWSAILFAILSILTFVQIVRKDRF